MALFKFWGWDKKPRTMIRFIRPGDIFCFRHGEKEYMFGRIISRVSCGHVVELFDWVSQVPEIDGETILGLKRLKDLEIPRIKYDVFILDSYSSFDAKKPPGYNWDWRIIGRHEDFDPAQLEMRYFVFGIEDDWTKVDMFDNKLGSVPTDVAMQFPRVSPQAPFHVEAMLRKKMETH